MGHVCRSSQRAWPLPPFNCSGLAYLHSGSSPLARSDVVSAWNTQLSQIIHSTVPLDSNGRSSVVPCFPRTEEIASEMSGKWDSNRSGMPLPCLQFRRLMNHQPLTNGPYARLCHGGIDRLATLSRAALPYEETDLMNWPGTRAQLLHWLISDEYRPEYLSCVIWPPAQSVLMSSRRCELIRTRVRVLSVAFAILTLLWIPVDVATLPTHAAGVLAVGRLLASAALVYLAVMTRRTPSLASIYGSLVALYAVPTAFFFGSLLLFQQPGLSPIARIALDVYGVLPVVAMAGLGVFPLTVVETAAFSAPIVIGEVIAYRVHLGAFLPGGIVDAVWLLCLMAGIALVVGASQLAFAVALVGRSLQDSLTGCFSRASTTELLEMHFMSSKRIASPVAVAFLDLDHFKAVNDKFGHEAGDEVLASAARRIRAVLRGSECIGRWGGEEFVVLFPGKTAHEAIECIERIRAAGLGQLPNGRAISISVGVAERIADRCAAAMSLVRLADQRMYAAKRAGRDCIVGLERG